jgi:hypothetical protein
MARPGFSLVNFTRGGLASKRSLLAGGELPCHGGDGLPKDPPFCSPAGVNEKEIQKGQAGQAGRQTQKETDAGAESGAGTVRSNGPSSSEDTNNQPTSAQIIQEATRSSQDTGEAIAEAHAKKAKALHSLLSRRPFPEPHR